MHYGIIIGKDTLKLLPSGYVKVISDPETELERKIIVDFNNKETLNIKPNTVKRYMFYCDTTNIYTAHFEDKNFEANIYKVNVIDLKSKKILNKSQSFKLTSGHQLKMKGEISF